MIKSPRKLCTASDCNELATHGILSQRHCETHSKKDEYNLVERTCSKCKRVDILNKDGICVSYCSYEKQDQIMKRHIKKKEEFIANLLKRELPHLNVIRDSIVDGMCSRARPDFVYDFGHFVLVIEVDENQHRSYSSCGNTVEERMATEKCRMVNIFQGFGGCPVVFIRYNPDSFASRDGKISKIPEKKRQETFMSWVKKVIVDGEKGVFTGCSVKYLFYDGYTESDMSFETLEATDFC